MYTTLVMKVSFHVAFAILEKYHDQLLACFPEDYMITLEKISQKFPSPVPASAVELLTTPTTALAVNQRILAFLFSYPLVYDVNAKRGIFFSVAAALQEVAGSDKLEMCRQFQQGRAIHVICVYVCVCVCVFVDKINLVNFDYH